MQQINNNNTCMVVELYLLYNRDTTYSTENTHIVPTYKIYAAVDNLKVYSGGGNPLER